MSGGRETFESIRVKARCQLNHDYQVPDVIRLLRNMSVIQRLNIGRTIWCEFRVLIITLSFSLCLDVSRPRPVC